MRRTFLLAMVLAAFAMVGCSHHDEDMDAPDSETERREQSGTSAGPDRGVRSGGPTDAGTGAGTTR